MRLHSTSDDFFQEQSRINKKTIELNGHADQSADEYTLPKDDATSYLHKSSLPELAAPTSESNSN